MPTEGRAGRKKCWICLVFQGLESHTYLRLSTRESHSWQTLNWRIIMRCKKQCISIKCSNDCYWSIELKRNFWGSQIETFSAWRFNHASEIPQNSEHEVAKRIDRAVCNCQGVGHLLISVTVSVITLSQPIFHLTPYHDLYWSTGSGLPLKPAGNLKPTFLASLRQRLPHLPFLFPGIRNTSIPPWNHGAGWNRLHII